MRILLGVVVLISPVLLIAYLIGSLILSGGQVGPAKDPMWGVVIPYPLFVVSTMQLVVVGSLSVALAIAVAVTTRLADVPRVNRLIGPTVASLICAFGWALATPENPTRFNDGVIGTQWHTSVFSIVALGILLLAMRVARSREPARSDQGGIR